MYNLVIQSKIVVTTTNLAYQYMEKFKPEEHIGRLIVRARTLLSQQLQLSLKAHGHTITPEQWAILLVLWEGDGISQTQLAERAFKDHPTTTRMLKLLEYQGLVVREKNPDDRRAYIVCISEKGRALMDELIPHAIDVLNKAQVGLSKKETDDLKRMLNIIISNLQ